MHTMMTKEQLLANQPNWQLVEEIQLVEQRNRTMQERWQRLNALARLAIGLGHFPQRKNEVEIDEARARWVRLKELASDSTN